MTLLALLAIVWLAGLAVASIAWVIPGANSSRLQIRIREIRDDVEDEIEDGFYRDARVAAEFRDLADNFSENVGDLSVARVLAMYFCATPQDKAEVRKAILEANRLDDLPEDQRERLEQHRTAFEAAVLRHLQYGTPSGWVVSGLLILLRPLARLVGKADRPAAARATVSEEAVGLVMHCVN